MALTVLLSEILDAARDAHAAVIHTSIPGMVLDYDPVTQTATVQPMIKVPMVGPDGDPGEAETLPPIPLVRVSFPQGNGYAIHWDLVKGDTVDLVFSEAGTAHWRVSGEISEPGDATRHSLSYPFAVPGTGPDAKALLGPADPTNAGKMVLGQDGTAQVNVIKIGPGGIEIGGPVTVPLAQAPPVITAFGALATYAAALTTALATQATYALFQAAMVAPGATLATAMGLVAAATPTTIVKGK